MPHGTFALTFDDGPDRVWTPRVLTELQQCEARATFFLIGERVQEVPWVAQALQQAGQEIALHCQRHIRHTMLTEEEIEQDTRAALRTLAGVGAQPSHWRTPWGITTEASVRVAKHNDLELIHWTTDTHDWRGDRAPEMLSRASNELHNGAVVLMHDALGPGALRVGCAETVALIAPLIADARNRGLEVLPLADSHEDALRTTPEPAPEVTAHARWDPQRNEARE